MCVIDWFVLIHISSIGLSIQQAEANFHKTHEFKAADPSEKPEVKIEPEVEREKVSLIYIYSAFSPLIRLKLLLFKG